LEVDLDKNKVAIRDLSKHPKEVIEEIISLVTDSLTSEHSRRAYRQSLKDFLIWYSEQGKPGLSKRVVQRYKRYLQDRELSPATINLRLCAIRKFIREATDNDLIKLKPRIADGIERVKGVRNEGTRIGNWLNLKQAQELLDAPDTKTLKGKRDQAILATLLGTGLRRTEIARLTFSHLQQREGRWVIVDIRGKRNRVRSIPIPSWVKFAIDKWAKAACIKEGYIFRSMRKGDRSNGWVMSTQGIRNVVKEYTEAIGLKDIAPHDLRRTFAKLVYKAGAELSQIQMTLGHYSIETTERYLGVEQDLTNAPCDKLELRI
jgi:site-specific recombinase XerD